MPKTPAPSIATDSVDRCCALIERRLQRRCFPDAQLEALWWRRPMTVLTLRLDRVEDQLDRLASRQPSDAAALLQERRLKGDRLRLYALSQKVVRGLLLNQAAQADLPVELGVLTNLEEALTSASWGVGTASRRLIGPSLSPSIPNPPRLELQAKLVAAFDELPHLPAADIYAAVDRAGYPRRSARKFMDNRRNQLTRPGRRQPRGNSVLDARLQVWRPVLRELWPEGLDLDTYFQSL